MFKQSITARFQAYAKNQGVSGSEDDLLEYVVRDIYWLRRSDPDVRNRIRIYENSIESREFFSCSNGVFSEYMRKYSLLRPDISLVYDVSDPHSRRQLAYEFLFGVHRNGYVASRSQLLFLNFESKRKSFLPGFPWLNLYDLVIDGCGYCQIDLNEWSLRKQQECLGFLLLNSKLWMRYVGESFINAVSKSILVEAILNYLSIEKGEIFNANPSQWLRSNAKNYYYKPDFILGLLNISDLRFDTFNRERHKHEFMCHDFDFEVQPLDHVKINLFIKSKYQFFLGVNNKPDERESLLEFIVRDIYWINNTSEHASEKHALYQTCALTKNFFSEGELFDDYTRKFYELRPDLKSRFSIDSDFSRSELIYELVFGESSKQFFPSVGQIVALNNKSESLGVEVRGFKWRVMFDILLAFYPDAKLNGLSERGCSPARKIGFLLLYSKLWRPYFTSDYFHEDWGMIIAESIKSYLNEDFSNHHIESDPIGFLSSRNYYADIAFLENQFYESFTSSIYSDFVQDHIFNSVSLFSKSNDESTPEISHDNSVSVIGFSKAEIGTGEDTRTVFSAVSKRFPNSNIYSVSPEGGIYRALKTKWAEYESEHLGGIQIYTMPPTTFLFQYMSNPVIRNSKAYKIGFFPWEFHEWKSEYDVIYDVLDEIWVISRFLMTAFQNKKIPVKPVPLIVELEEGGCYRTTREETRSFFNLPQHTFLFFVGFDIKSSLARKNPQAALDAFIAEYSCADDVGLVIKTCADSGDIELNAKFFNQVYDAKNVFLINEMIDKELLYSLIESCDCLVSPHRSEGFGRFIAEAMLLEVPVIVTDYSGSSDICSNETSFLVDYQLVPVGYNEYPFAYELLWADVVIQSLREKMEIVRSGGPEVCEKITNAKKFILKHHNMGLASELMCQRLEVLMRDS